MRNSTSAAFAVALAVAAFSAPASAKEGKKAGSAVLTPGSAIVWKDVPEFPGVSIAVLEGDPAKGPHHSMMKFKDGFAAPLHFHSSDHYVTVLSGTLALTVDGKETLLPAGSFFCFKGKKLHTTRCAPGADCVISVDVRGKWDVVPAGPAPAAKG